jgi:predicted component of type VI protein secretion system
MASHTFQMVMQTGPTPNKSFTLSKQEIVIGRDTNEDIVINVAEISRRHTRLRLEAKGYIIEDLGSTNGTFVNGNRLTGPQLLRTGDTVDLGDAVTLIFQSTILDPDATIVSPVKRQTAVSPPPAPVSATPTPAKASKGLASTAQPVEEEKPSRPWLWASVGCLGIIVCLVAIGAIAFDTMNLYCTPPFDSLLQMLYPCP